MIHAPGREDPVTGDPEAVVGRCAPGPCVFGKQALAALNEGVQVSPRQVVDRRDQVLTSDARVT